jgi:hypothetical protein
MDENIVPYHQVATVRPEKVSMTAKVAQLSGGRLITVGMDDSRDQLVVNIKRPLPDGKTSLLVFNISFEGARTLGRLLQAAAFEMEGAKSVTVAFTEEQSNG